MVLLAAGVAFVGACAQFPGIGGFSFSSAWSHSPKQVFTGKFQKDGQVNTYKVVLEPVRSKSVSGGRTEMEMKMVLSVAGADYSASYLGKLEITGEVQPQVDDAPYQVTKMRVLTPVAFDEIDPLIYMNVWPSVEKSLVDNYAQMNTMTVERK
jgi:hypothetical protein